MIIWFTGFSGSGKSAIAKEMLPDHRFILDGDTWRNGLNSDLGFSLVQRTENIRRMSHIAKYLNNYGPVVVPAITPTVQIRDMMREIVGEENLLLVYIKTSLELCEARDPKGLYKRARSGEIKQFTGISSQYDYPMAYENAFTVETAETTPKECAQAIWHKYYKRITG